MKAHRRRIKSLVTDAVLPWPKRKKRSDRMSDKKSWANERGKIVEYDNKKADGALRRRPTSKSGRSRPE